MTGSESAAGGGAPWPPDPVDASRTASAVVDPRGVVTEWSTGAVRLLGYTSAEMVGRPAAHLLAEKAPVDALRAVESRTRWHGMVTLRHRDGRHLTVSVLAHFPETGGAAGRWLVLSPVGGDQASFWDDTLMMAAFAQAPASMALFDSGLRLRRVNAEMERALGMPERAMRGLRAPEIVAEPEADRTEQAMRRAFATGERQRLRQAVRVAGHEHKRVWSTSMTRVQDSDGTVRGVLLSAQDTTEEHMARERLALLNDASVRIGSTLDLTRTAQELVDVAVPRLADFATVDLLLAVEAGEEPRDDTRAGHVVLRRAAYQSVLDGAPEAVVPRGAATDYPNGSPAAECLVLGRPLIREVTHRMVDSWAKHRAHADHVRRYGFHSVLAVPMQARGVTLGVALFSRHQRPEPFEQDDLMLAEEITARAAVCVDNARRYTRERGTSLTLQNSLLPRSLPPQTAVEVASRYLPAGTRSGVGGDWFDLIPLSGARVALVVGDVVGHGIQASATMGRLRTAVRTLADVDLPPDELLTHLDDLVIHLSSESDNTSGPVGDIGATCLYAVYDPVSRRCTLARAGHPLPALASPDGTAKFLDVPAGPPLGLGGLPFESTEIELPEGSTLALYTDGLIEARGRDIDEGLDKLLAALAQPAPSLEGTCDAMLRALLPAHPIDDVALLTARTRAFDAAHVAAWDVAPTPSAVAETRENACRKLDDWDLHEAVFVTELVVSELVTNAIRYGSAPIRLRLIRDRDALICEVSDANNTAPHLRRARAFDEGGRGLLLVAQLTHRWGTRQTYTGKTIWAEQAQPRGRGGPDGRAPGGGHDREHAARPAGSVRQSL
ncbi:SpoIIE family protein phosphatase [Yinghuangia sp. ASG 101]|uniref:SpoIIE family protein phosphatase n=1 Tax=Yinghuangia sp. ASG 101 TaxID=2896848 RepID=UPI001E4B18B0|nr:SpoIIE family protein phosphatase [Yinghuangia sp. ASG 101]UGQ11676.1 SpoIIE family protein phosphatase [Yinghuangia sp. ASG 101]